MSSPEGFLLFENQTSHFKAAVSKRFFFYILKKKKKKKEAFTKSGGITGHTVPERSGTLISPTLEASYTGINWRF